jgi:hypothetical protein
VLDARLAASEEGLLLSADFAFDFNPRLNEAVANGVPLYFIVEFELTRPRWYWFDENAVSRSTQLRLSYQRCRGGTGCPPTAAGNFCSTRP